MFKLLFKITVCALVMAITHPYAFFSFVFRPLQVTIYWDAADQDEDTFVSRVNPEDGRADMVYQEESKRDHDQKSKLKLKFKVVYFASRPQMHQAPDLGVEIQTLAPHSLLQSFLTDHFHPPDFLA